MEEKLKKVVENFIQAENIKEILNNNIIKILGRTKKQIGQGWIRKLIGIPQEMSQQEYKIACEKLSKGNLPHKEEIRLKGKDEKTKERIDYLHRINQFKLELMPVFNYEPERN